MLIIDSKDDLQILSLALRTLRLGIKTPPLEDVPDTKRVADDLQQKVDVQLLVALRRG